MRELSDRECLLKIRKGEIYYFEHIVKRYTKQIYSYLYNKIFDKREIEDLVQNTFISFYRAIDRFDIERPILPYLYEITKNEMKMYFRARKHSLSLDEAIYMDSGNDLKLDEENLDDLLKVLNNDERRALTMLYEGYSYQEISKKIGKPLNSTKTLIRRARIKLFKLKNDKA